MAHSKILEIGSSTICSHSLVQYLILIYLYQMSDQDNLKQLRAINSNNYIQVQHQFNEHGKFAQEKTIQKSHEGYNHHRKDDEGHSHTHDHSQHSHSHSHSKRIPGQKNYCIIIYCIFTCFSCLYLETQYLNPLLDDFKSHLMTYLTYFDVFMCLWSYFQTMRINSHVEKLQQKEQKPYTLDYQKRCDKCNYWKGPRISHCSSCGKCIYKLDHHCMWTQTCIGHCNQRPFYLFCFYMTIGVFQFWYSTIRVMSLMNANCNFLGYFQPGIYILWLLTCISAGLIGLMIVGLCFGHFFFIITNFTTLESMKTRRAFSLPFIQSRASYLAADAINFWDRGEIQNLKAVFGNNIFTFWMPFGRQIVNQHVFQPMNPIVQYCPKKLSIKTTRSQAEGVVKGMKLRINDGILQM